MKRGVWLIVGLVLLLGSGLVLHTALARPLRLDWLYLRIALEEQWAEPGLDLLRSPWLRPLMPAADRLPDYSPEHDKARFRRAERQLRHWSGFDCADQAEAQRETCEVLGYALTQRLEGERWRLYSYPVNPLFGIQSNLPGLIIGAEAFTSWSDAEAVIARMQAVPHTMQGVLASLQERQAAGLFPPKLLVEHVLRELRAFVALPPAQHALMSAFRERSSALDINPYSAERQRYEAQALQAIDESVYPAWRELIAHFEQLEPVARSNDGAWSRADGDAWYAYLVRQYTSSELSPEQVFQIGLDEVARITQELDQALRALGETEGEVGARLLRLAEQPAQRFESGTPGRIALLNHVRMIIARSRRQVEPWFDAVSAAPLAVEAVPAVREATAPLAYYVATAQGEGGTLFINLRDVGDLPRFALPALAHHEAIPGHHLQVSQQRALQLPAFRQLWSYSAYAEGWAMYAERLAGEVGMGDAALERVGRLQSELFRAARLVVDSGIHYQRWDRQRAIRYLHERAGLGLRDATAEVDRYIVHPGQALSFNIGMQRILAARERARIELGPAFSLRDFHRVALGGGNLPLDLFDARIDRYIAATRVARPSTGAGPAPKPAHGASSLRAVRP